MPARVERVQPTPPQGEPAGPGGSGETRSFEEMVKGAAQEVNRLQLDVDSVSERVSTGQVEDLHTAMIAVQKASLALELTLQVRNKAIESYQEIMRMQL
jgi:flagellar hook-basal body complex protein FliE